MAFLEVETPDGSRRVSLAGDRLTVGRLPYNDIVISSSQISRQHAELRLVNNQWWIADLQSTNGILFDGKRIKEHAFQHGDRITLAPDITLRFVDEQAASSPGKPQQGGSNVGWGRSQPGQMPQHPQTLPDPPFAPRPPAQPTQPYVPPSSVAPLRPRSIFSDDEVPYVPPGMAASQPPVPPGFPGASSMPGISGAPGNFSSGSYPAQGWGTASNPNIPNSPTMPPYGTSGSGNASSGGYPAPQGPLQTGAESQSHDFYRRGGAQRRQPTAGPVPTLLHVCQTCGQLTAPDSVYCQNCHQSIASECVTCRLSLLPIQERCPRCHTPNSASVRRAHPGRSAM